MRPDELERRLRERLDALGPAPRAELLHVLRMPDFERADRIGSYCGNPKTQTFAELLTTVRDRSSGRCWSAKNGALVLHVGRRRRGGVGVRRAAGPH